MIVEFSWLLRNDAVFVESAFLGFAVVLSVGTAALLIAHEYSYPAI